MPQSLTQWGQRAPGFTEAQLPGPKEQKAPPSLGKFGGQYMRAALPGIKAVTPQFYGKMGHWLARGGFTDPQFFNDQMASIGHMTTGMQSDYLDRLAEMGMQRSVGGQAQLSAIGGAGANMAQNVLTTEQQQAAQRMMQLLAMLGMYSTEPGMGAVGLAEGGRQFDRGIEAQEGDKWLRALGALAGGMPWDKIF